MNVIIKSDVPDSSGLHLKPINLSGKRDYWSQLLREKIMNIDSLLEATQEKIKKVTNSLGGFMGIHKVVTVYLWPFVFVGVVVAILIGVDLWRN